MLHHLRLYGDPVLATTAMPVTKFDSRLISLTETMFDVMYKHKGIGLAAPQIGVSLQVFVYDVGGEAGILVNPRITETSGEWEFTEGCLSVPNLFMPVTRPNQVTVEAVDVTGRPVTVTADRLFGRMLQHEVDHLNGVVFLDRVPRGEA